MKKIFIFILSVLLSVAGFAQQHNAILPTVSSMKLYTGPADQIFVFESTLGGMFSLLPASSGEVADEDVIFAGVGGRKWKRQSAIGPIDSLIITRPIFMKPRGSGRRTDTLQIKADTPIYKPSDITGLISQGANVTITGSGTPGSPYVIASTGGGGGGVSSVGLTVPSGLTVSGSPVTSSGTLAITTSLAGLVSANGSGFAAVTTSAGISGLLSDETGSGALVFAGSPVFTGTPTIPSFASANHNHTNSAGGGTLSEAALALTNVTTNDVSTTQHGFQPKLPNTAGTYGFDGITGAYVLASGGGSGVTTMAAIGSSPNANGATISGVTLNLQPASASFGGVVTAGTQTFAGAKTWNGSQTFAPLSAQATGLLYLGTGGLVTANAAIFAVDETNTRVGIGIGSAPLYTLQISKNDGSYNPTIEIGDAKPDGYTMIRYAATGNKWSTLVGNASEATFGVSNDYALFNATSNTVAYDVDPTNRMGINTTAQTNRLEVVENLTAQTTANLYTIRATNTGTYNATAAVRASAAVYASNTATRSSGSNNLTNYGGWFEASGGQVNIAGRFDGGFILNLGSDATGDTYFRNSSGQIQRLAVGSGTQVIIGGTTPSWGAVDLSTAMVTNTLVPTKGGTGLNAIATGDILYGSATNTWARLADITTGNVLKAGGVGTAPFYGKVDVTADITGIGSVANGFTGVNTNIAYGLAFGGTTTGGVMQFLTPGASGTILQSLGTGSLPTWITTSTLGSAVASSVGTALGLASANFSPTVTALGVNLSGVTADGFKYMRIGNMVHVSGRVHFSLNTAGGTAQHVIFTISLPFATDLQNDYEVTGICAPFQNGSPSSQAGVIYGVTSTDVAQADFTSGTTFTIPDHVYIEFTYYLNPA